MARDLGAQYELLTGEKLELFLDRDTLAWGDEWQQQIDESLASVAFFVPVLTPRYFRSAECRRELQAFARKAKKLGVTELLMPLVYVDVLELHSEVAVDEVVNLVRGFQWQDWTDLRFKARRSEAYRRAVAVLAQRLVDANSALERNPIPISSAADQVGLATPKTLSEDDEPGFLDRVAGAEENFPKVVATLDAMNSQVELVGSLTSESADEMRKVEAHGGGFGPKLILARKLAAKLAPPAELVLELGNQFAFQMHEIDEGLRPLIARANEEAGESEENRIRVCEFFATVRKLKTSAHGGITAIRSMLEATVVVEKLSRDLRPSLRKLRQGLTTMIEASQVIDDWVRLIDETGLSCEEAR